MGHASGRSSAALCLGVTIPGQGLNEVVGGITTQLTTYGSAINAETDVINALKVYSSSGVMPGTFRDLQVR